MKKILVPCDFSEPAISAFRFAADIAAQSKGQVYLLNVVEMPVIHDSFMVPVTGFEEGLFSDLKDSDEKEFRKMIAKYGKDTKVKTEVRFGSVSLMISDYAAEIKADLIVMGTHGTKGVRELIGSNAEKVVRTSEIPVLAVKKYPKGPIKNIVFPNTLDTVNQEELVMKVKAVQDFFKATLHIVWVNTPTNFTRDTITLKRLKEFARRYMLKNFTLNIFNDPYEESGVLNFAHSIGADLIAMGTHGRRGLAHFFIGSVAEDILNHVDCPIWTVKMK